MTDALTTIARAAPEALGAVARILEAAQRDPEVARAAIAARERRHRLRLAARTRREAYREEERRQRRIARLSWRLYIATRRHPEAAHLLAAPLLCVMDEREVAALLAWRARMTDSTPPTMEP